MLADCSRPNYGSPAEEEGDGIEEITEEEGAAMSAGVCLVEGKETISSCPASPRHSYKGDQVTIAPGGVLRQEGASGTADPMESLPQDRRVSSQ